VLDRLATTFIAPAVQAGAGCLHRMGLRADTISLAGFATGMMAACLIANGAHALGLVAILLSRILDALDGALARLTEPTDAGGFLDITLDFIFYASIPLAFAINNPPQNALPAAVLLAAFIGTGSSFLAFAVLAAKQGRQSAAYPNKSFYFLGGLTEASETLLCFAAMCLWPQLFPEIAYGFAGLCGITIISRVVGGYLALKRLAK
jgi:phosphatidylglycerophosphate synthase